MQSNHTGENLNAPSDSLLSFPPNRESSEQQALARAIACIRESLDLGVIFQTTVTEVRQLLQADRVAIFQFDPDGDWNQGSIIAEDVLSDWKSALTIKVEDHCFGDRFAIHYKQGRVQAVSDIYQAGLSDCHQQILDRFQIRANLVVPLLQDTHLWGLLCVHQCSYPRDWTHAEIEFVQRIASQLAVALLHSESLLEARYQAEQQKALTSVISRILESQDLDSILQTTVTEVRRLLKTDRAAILQFETDRANHTGTFIAEETLPDWNSISGIQLKNAIAPEPNRSPRRRKRPVADPIQVIPDATSPELSAHQRQTFSQLQIRAGLIVPLQQGQERWGLLCLHQCSGTRHWDDREIEFARQIAKHLEVALQQANYLQQVQAQAEQLEKATERQRALATTIDKIRTSLDLDTIFRATTQEVRQLLEVERVAIYRFYPDWSGEFVADSIVDGWIPQATAAPNFTPIDLFSQFTHSGDYPRNETFVPILQGEKLWGLLVAYQNTQPRYWEEEEINLLAQVGVQLGVAIQQAESLRQMQVQTAQLAKAAERERMLAATAEKIRQCPDVQTIFDSATEAVRQLLQVDRVVVYRFNADWSGEFISESVAAGWISVLETQPVVADTHLQDTQGGRYCHKETFAVDDIYSTDHSDCHLDLLEQFEAKAYAIAPLFQGDKLWGLLAVYQNSKPRHWQADEIDLLVKIGMQLEVALQQADYWQQMQAQSAQLAEAAERERAVERQKALAKTVDRIRRFLDIDTIFSTTTQEVRELLKADRVVIYRFYSDWSGEFVSESVAEGWMSLMEVQPVLLDTYLQDTEGGRYARNETLVVDDIYQQGWQSCHLALLEQMQAKAYAIVPILQGETLWGLLAVYQNSQPRQWKVEEVDLLAQVGVQMGIALQQTESLKHMRIQSAQLAEAAEREKAIERQNALAATIDKIRRSLDIDTIFSTTTQEVRQLLETERVEIYRFNSDWSGEFVAESLAPGWESLLGKQVVDTYLQETQGGRYALNQCSTVRDIDESGYAECHVTLLHHLNVKAYAIAPIFQADKLWGLLAAYQTAQPRDWLPQEIDLLAQIGTQLGIALQQAELLEQTQKQATELNQMLQDLHRSQSQLIQSEKMASLGQLVAGVAHEINNPVSFIYGNLTHISEYTQDLLKLIEIYQQNYPNLSPTVAEQIALIDLDFLTEDLPKTLVSMKIGAERIREIVLSLRTFSRLDRAQMQPVDLHEGIDSTLLILGHRLKADGDRPAIEVIKQYGELPLVECYAAQLNQVFMNLLSNAIDALEERFDRKASQSGFSKADAVSAVTSIEKTSPTLRIQTEAIQPDLVSIRVSDNGAGILEQLRSRLFDPFFTTKEPGRGTGMGLSISYQIVVEKHGGQLRCLSQPGEGTEFCIEIPIVQV